MYKEPKIVALLGIVILSWTTTPAVHSAGADGPDLEAPVSGLYTGFIENRGQIDSRVSYYAIGSQVGIYFTAGAVVLDLRGGAKQRAVDQAAGVGDRLSSHSREDSMREGCAVWIRFDGADASPQIEA